MSPPGSPQRRRSGSRGRVDRKSVGLFVLVCAIWGGSIVAGKIALRYSQPIALAGARLLVAGVLLGIYVALTGGRLVPRRDDLTPILSLGVLDGLGSFLFYVGLRSTPAGMGAILNQARPLLIAALAPVLLRERVLARRWRRYSGTSATAGRFADPLATHRLSRSARSSTVSSRRSTRLSRGRPPSERDSPGSRDNGAHSLEDEVAQEVRNVTASPDRSPKPDGRFRRSDWKRECHPLAVLSRGTY